MQYDSEIAMEEDVRDIARIQIIWQVRTVCIRRIIYANTSARYVRKTCADSVQIYYDIAE